MPDRDIAVVYDEPPIWAKLVGWLLLGTGGLVLAPVALVNGGNGGDAEANTASIVFRPTEDGVPLGRSDVVVVEVVRTTASAAKGTR